MARIIVEGPDGAGKSYTVDHIRSTVSLPVYPTQGPPKTPTEIIRRVKNVLEMDNFIFDRFPLISEMVYAPILRTPTYDPLWLDRFSPERDIIIYCRPPKEIILNTVLQSKPHKSEEHVKAVREVHEKIIDRYDFIMGRMPWVWHYNRQEKSMETLCAELICALEKIKSN